MKNHIIIITSLVFFLSSCQTSQPEKSDNHTSTLQTKEQVDTKAQTYHIGFYNVENLFDIYDDPYTQDEWFLPSSETNWNQKKYNKKLEDLATVIDAMNTNQGGPDLIGLCEVENEKVVKELSEEVSLKANHYKIVHYDSPDTRGIDVAAMYDASKFELLNSRSIFVAMPEQPSVKTRDILYCQFATIGSQEIIHFYVNHWSSRRKGENETYFKRKNCAQTLKDDIVKNITDWENQNIIIVGDMNDYPTNKSIYKDLGAKEYNSNANLVNLQYSNHQKGKGTYNHQGEWGCLDNVIISKNLKEQLPEKDAVILKKEWMLYTNKTGDSFPNKTYGGTHYYGGYSDHLPVYFNLKL